MTDQPGVRFTHLKAGRFTLAFIALDNPRALNALGFDMLRAIGEKLLQWREQEEIACVVLHSDSERAFSAGGDVKELGLALGRAGGRALARDYFTMEYFVDYLIRAYPKPVLCWADGITMGGGIGIMNGAACRVVTERSVLAMPEILLGLFPDVGATYFLNRLPDGVGLFLGLTGARFDGFDAVAVGLAEGVVGAADKRAVLGGLARLEWTDDPETNEEVLHQYLAGAFESDAAERSGIRKKAETIRRLVEGATLEEMDGALRGWRGEDAWIARAVRSYLGGAPFSLKVTFEQLRRGRALAPKEALLREWNMAQRMCERGDLVEGVRARLIDKDNRPRWNPATLSAVADDEVERFFSPHGDGAHPLAEKIRAAGLD